MNIEDFMNMRGAGILAHITSLPGAPLIGDLGPGAHEFVEFLSSAGQQVWQLLPLQPIEAGQGHSPYSSSSAMAGNVLLISPQKLLDDGLLEASDLYNESSDDGRTDYAKALEYKNTILEKAYQKWTTSGDESAKKQFDDFVATEDYWLNDYAMYAVVKNLQGGKPWFEWPDELKNRNHDALNDLQSKHADNIRQVKWRQMIFNRQWQQLRDHCSSKNIRLVGDIPIYVAYDSADVWSHRDIFTVNEDGSLAQVAGVPPDLFNDDGQLWGMPLYNWQLLESQHYDWWIKRIRKNTAWFDILRLDHFRGFSSYWSVPAGAATAKEGKWEPGPGTSLFNEIKAQLGGLPFIAEDLGEIDDPVYILRDESNLPGMNVLQFAFGDNMSKSPYIPHHHRHYSLVYTGTHDNNTTLGWFNELKPEDRKRLSRYLGMRITERNVADKLCRLAYMSVSNLAILPIQDVLGLDGSARMNMPASAEGNWAWRMTKQQLTGKVIAKLRGWGETYNRLP
jgi:4-alpha-glucanotransferase